jgi:hypothetical protein
MGKPRERKRILATEDSQTSDAYEVGYCKPPKETRFGPGQSGNPKGRPSSRPKRDPTLADILDEKIRVPDKNGRSRWITKREYIDRKIVKKAGDGDHRSIMLTKEHERRLANGEPDPEPLYFDPALSRSILDEYEKEIKERADKTRKSNRKKR